MPIKSFFVNHFVVIFVDICGSWKSSSTRKSKRNGLWNLTDLVMMMQHTLGKVVNSGVNSGCLWIYRRGSDACRILRKKLLRVFAGSCLFLR